MRFRTRRQQMRRSSLALIVALVGALAVAAAATAATVTVAPGHLGNWSVVNDTCGAATTGTVNFVSGPGSVPAGTGSVQLTVGSNGDSYPTVRNSGYSGVKLSTLTALDYYTYVSHAGAGSQAPYIDLYIDYTGDGIKDDTLTFEPVYSPTQGTVTLNTWQHWDALKGQWWSDAAGGPPPFFTISSYLAAHPNATIVNSGSGGVILAAGCGGSAWTNFAGNADALTIGVSGTNTTYDFEPASQPTGKDTCKHGGWKNFSNPSFKNQGQCVSYMNHHDGRGADDDHAHGHGH
jgi:hypothetical protein